MSADGVVSASHSPSGSETSDPLIGYSANGIRIDALLRSSSRLRTYHAMHAVQQRAVIVQIVGEPWASDPAYVTWWQREADQLVSIRHLNVQCCLEHWICEGPQGRLLATIYETLRGLTLKALARTDRLPVRDVILLMQQIAEGLAATHHVGLFHGGLSLDAVTVTEGGFAKLHDFSQGHSEASGDGSYNLGQPPEFCAPEMGRGQPPSVRSDLYSLGIMIYAVLMGEPPFTATTALECLHLHQTSDIPKIGGRLPACEPIDALLQDLLAKDPAARPASAEQVAHALQRIGEQMPSAVRCLPQSDDRVQPLAAIVRKGLSASAELPAMPHLAQSTAPSPTMVSDVSPSATSRPASQPGTTSISRSSVDYFKNPELFKPTMADGESVSADESSVRAEGTASIAKPSTQRVVNVQTSTPITVLPSAATTSSNGKPMLSLVIGVMVLGMAVAGGIWWQTANAVTQPQATDRSLQTTSVPHASTQQNWKEKVQLIRAQAWDNPNEALQAAEALRGAHPEIPASALPVALPLHIEGPAWSHVRVSADGKPVSTSTDSVICRWPGQELPLEIAATGFVTQSITVPSELPAGWTGIHLRLVNAPQWTVSQLAPTWSSLVPWQDSVLVLSDRKVALLSMTNGEVVSRLDSDTFPGIVPEQVTWVPMTNMVSQDVVLGTTTGLGLALRREDPIAAHIVLKQQGAIRAWAQAPLTLRLNEMGTFICTRRGPVYVIEAANAERELWSREIFATRAPWLVTFKDQVITCLDEEILFFDQEGAEKGRLKLLAPRSAEPIWQPSLQRLLVPTMDGVELISWTEKNGWRREQTWLARSSILAMTMGVGGLHICATDHVVVLKPSSGEERWRWPGTGASSSPLQAMGVNADFVVVADAHADLHVLTVTDGIKRETLQLPVPVMCPPTIIGQNIVVVESSGHIRSYALAQ